MYFDQQAINNELQKELLRFEKRRKIEYISIWFFLCGFLICVFGLPISIGSGNFVMSFIFFFTSILLVLLFGIKKTVIPASKTEEEIISYIFDFLGKETFRKHEFNYYGKVEASTLHESKLYHTYVHTFRDYYLTGVFQQNKIEIFRLLLKNEVKDNHFEGVFMTGTFKNPFPKDVLFGHVILDTEREKQNRKDAYRGQYSRSGEMQWVPVTLNQLLANSIRENVWGDRREGPYNQGLISFSPYQKSLRYYLNPEMIEQITTIFRLLPDSNIYISFRGDSFYIGLETKPLLPFSWEKSFTQIKTIENYTDTYFRLLEVTEIITHLHEIKKRNS